MRWNKKVKITVGPVEVMAACVEQAKVLGYKPHSVEFNEEEPCTCMVFSTIKNDQGRIDAVRLTFEYYGGTPRLVS